MKNFKIYSAVFLLLVIISTFAFLNHKDEEKTDEIKISKPEIISQVKLENNIEIAEEEPLNTPASTQTNRIEKYIIKCEEEDCVLITRFENGKETKSPMPDIDVTYLTEMDREQLAKGIELYTEEELFKLIEDYSS